LDAALDPCLLAEGHALGDHVALELARDLGRVGLHVRLDPRAFAHYQAAGDRDLALEPAEDVGVLPLERPFDVRLRIDERPVHEPPWGVSGTISTKKGGCPKRGAGPRRAAGRVSC